jgi:oligopeptide/dipeptide ABC transporter ATP-binding protein
MTLPLLEARNLRKYFPAARDAFGLPVSYVKAVENVSFSIAKGRTLGLVGESGCGKSTTGRLVARLLDTDSGELRFDGEDLLKLDRRELKQLRRHLQFIFQDPYSSLNPRMTIGDSIAEGLIVNGIGNRSERQDRIASVLSRVGLTPEMMDRYPHEFSGGQRQRIGIARALVLEPKLIVADEPVSALDVSIQAQVMNLMVEIQEEFGLSFLFVAHDLAVVEHMADDIAVMYLGSIVEMSNEAAITSNPLHPYTRLLISTVPSLEPGARKVRSGVGDLPNSLDQLGGCSFQSRCPHRMEECGRIRPELREAVPGHWVACHLYNAIEAPAAEAEIAPC